MEGSSLFPGQRYLFRSKGKQVPVEFIGREPGVLIFQRLDTLEIFKRRAARALSKHYDSCVIHREMLGRRCGCSDRLISIAKVTKIEFSEVPSGAHH